MQIHDVAISRRRKKRLLVGRFAIYEEATAADSAHALRRRCLGTERHSERDEMDFYEFVGKKCSMYFVILSGDTVQAAGCLARKYVEEKSRLAENETNVSFGKLPSMVQTGWNTGIAAI